MISDFARDAFTSTIVQVTALLWPIRLWVMKITRVRMPALCNFSNQAESSRIGGFKDLVRLKKAFNWCLELENFIKSENYKILIEYRF